MAIDRTGINSLNADGSDSLEAGGPEQLRLTGDVRMAQKLPPQLEQMIKQYWIQEGGSAADRIEDIPQDFRDKIIQLFRQMASDPSPEAEWGDSYSNYKDKQKKKGLPIKPFNIWQEEILEGDFDPGRSTSAYGGTARPTYTQSRKERMAYGGIAGLDGRMKY